VVNDHLIDHDAGADRLDIALRRLVADARLTDTQADAVRAEFAGVPPSPDRPSWTAVLPEVSGYVGATFVMAAARARPPPLGLRQPFRPDRDPGRHGPSCSSVPHWWWR